jgi:hypothetical protein
MDWWFASLNRTHDLDPQPQLEVVHGSDLGGWMLNNVVLVNSASAFVLWANANRLLAHPAVLSEIGQIDQEHAPGHRPLSNHVKDVIAELATDDYRQRFANALALLGLQFLLAHEFRHAMPAHAAYRAAAPEGCLEDRLFTAEHQRAFEADADCFAAREISAFLSRHDFSESMPMLGALLDQRHSPVFYGLIAAHWYIEVGTTRSSGRYPTRPVRQLLIRSAAAEVATVAGSWLADEICAAHNEVDNAYDLIAASRNRCSLSTDELAEIADIKGRAVERSLDMLPS